MSQLFASRGPSIRASASASVLPLNTQSWSPLGLSGWISLQSKALKSLLQHHGSKASIPQCSVFFMAHLSQLCMTTGKTIALTRWTFVSEMMLWLFNMLSRFVIGAWSLTIRAVGKHSKSWSCPLTTQIRKPRPREGWVGSRPKLPDF